MFPIGLGYDYGTVKIIKAEVLISSNFKILSAICYILYGRLTTSEFRIKVKEELKTSHLRLCYFLLHSSDSANHIEVFEVLMDGYCCVLFMSDFELGNYSDAACYAVILIQT